MCPARPPEPSKSQRDKSPTVRQQSDDDILCVPLTTLCESSPRRGVQCCHSARHDRRFIPAAMIKHTGELHRLWMGRVQVALPSSQSALRARARAYGPDAAQPPKGHSPARNSEKATPRHVSMATAEGRNVSRASRNSGSILPHAAGRRSAIWNQSGVEPTSRSFASQLIPLSCVIGGVSKIDQ